MANRVRNVGSLISAATSPPTSRSYRSEVDPDSSKNVASPPDQSLQLTTPPDFWPWMQGDAPGIARATYKNKYRTAIDAIWHDKNKGRSKGGSHQSSMARHQPSTSIRSTNEAVEEVHFNEAIEGKAFSRAIREVPSREEYEAEVEKIPSLPRRREGQDEMYEGCAGEEH